ncbi:MAG: LysM peptidoglycan-binding protein [Cyanobacteriota bacterium erpe_2018_sw_21hr_WHONDRS-SW48-000092_B_bin.40]|nr:LysM peptidoglycan-binding protein [Cyanobacteriota bacterium erpe_2018_sw_21hr_WHONDRS-SW48-000092_B_bin.40]
MANNNAPAGAPTNLETQPVKPVNPAGETPAGLLKDAGAGVPEKKPEGGLDSGTTLPEKFRDAAGIDRLPAPGSVNGAARKVEDDASFGGPVRVRPQESMQTPDGRTVSGKLYTVQGQEYFAQTQGENRRIYAVTRSENGAPTLQPGDPKVVRPPRDGDNSSTRDESSRSPRRDVDPSVVKQDDAGGRTRREVDPSVVKQDDAGGRTRREVDPSVVKQDDAGGRTRRDVDPSVVKPEDLTGRHRREGEGKPEDQVPRRDPLVAKTEVPAARQADGDAPATSRDGTPARNPVLTERAEANRSVLSGQTDQTLTSQVAQRLPGEKAALPATPGDNKGQNHGDNKGQTPVGVNPGNSDSRPGSDNKSAPVVVVPEAKLPGAETKANPGANPVIEQRPTAPIVDGKSLQQVVAESKPFQQLPPEKQAEILKGLSEAPRQIPLPNQGDKPADAGAKPVDAGARPVDLGAKPADLGGKPIDLGPKPDPSIKVAEIKVPDGKPGEVKPGEVKPGEVKPGDLVPGRVLDPAGNPLRGPDGNPMKFSDMIAAGIKPGDILRAGEVKPGDGLKLGEGLKPGDAQKATDAIAGKAIDPSLVAKLGEGLKPGDKVGLPGAEVPVGKLAGDALSGLKDTKGGVSDGAAAGTTSALSDMAKALGLNADVARGVDGKAANLQDLKTADGALKAAADALKPTTLEAGKASGLPGEAGAKADVKGLDAARADGALSMAAKAITPEGLPPGGKDAQKADGALGAKGEVTGKLDSTGRPESLVQKIENTLAAPLAAGQRLEGDKIAPTVKVDQVPLAGDKLDPNTITKVELDPDKKLADTTGSAAKFDELLDKAKKQKEEEKFDEEDQLNSRNAMMMALLAQKKQKQEQEEKEFQLRNDDAKKKDEDKRRRYVVKEKETLESIAKKQLRDVRLAALIYEINKHMLPIRMEKGKQVVDPRPGTAIWLPTEAEIKEFRSRLYAATNTEAAVPGGKFASADDELAAKFGSGWDGAKTGTSAVDGMMGSAVAKSQTRRENIEKILGPMSDKPSDSARIRYIVRLTDSIESVAQKHPALKDASLWPLVASVNHLPTGLDQFGRPVAELRRGMVLDIPLPYEIERFRNESNAEDLEDQSDEDEDFEDEAEEEAVEVAVKRDLGVETADSAPAVSLPAQPAPTAVPPAATVMPPIPIPTPVVVAAPVPAPSPVIAPGPVQPSLQSQLAAQASAAVPPSPYTSQPLPVVSNEQPGQPAASPLPEPSFPFASQQAPALSNPTLPLPTQSSVVSAPTPASAAPVQTPAPAPVPTFNQAPAPPQPLPQNVQQHTVVSQPVAQQPASNIAPVASAPAITSVSAQSNSQTDTNPVLSAVPVLSQNQLATGAQQPQLRTALDQPPIDAGDRFIWQLDPSVRLVKSTMKWEPAVGVFRSQLELLLNEIWYPVIFYEVFPHMAVRHEYIGGGRKKSVKMDLPPAPAQELADNDLVNNWQRYCHTFVAQMNGPKTGPPM